MRPVLWILLGALIMYVLLKLFAKISVAPGTITARLKELADTSQARNLVRTNEFRELIKTREFVSLVTSLAEDQLGVVSRSLTDATVIK